MMAEWMPHEALTLVYVPIVSTYVFHNFPRETCKAPRVSIHKIHTFVDNWTYYVDSFVYFRLTIVQIRPVTTSFSMYCSLEM